MIRLTNLEPIECSVHADGVILENLGMNSIKVTLTAAGEYLMGHTFYIPAGKKYVINDCSLDVNLKASN